ncbi:MAG: hypothetical protein GY838_13420 [bacterium]|nr:hypothetical protein [bacterium]
MRGRLIFPMFVTVAPLDTEATETAAGYDDDYRTVTLDDTNGDGKGETKRVEGTPFEFKAQMENDMEEMQRMTKTGDLPNSAVGLVVHLRDMNRLGLITTSRPLGVKKGDRLTVQKNRKKAVVKTYDDPELFCTHAKHLDAYIGRQANMAILVFGERPKGVK